MFDSVFESEQKSQAHLQTIGGMIGTGCSGSELNCYELEDLL